MVIFESNLNNNNNNNSSNATNLYSLSNNNESVKFRYLNENPSSSTSTNVKNKPSSGVVSKKSSNNFKLKNYGINVKNSDYFNDDISNNDSQLKDNSVSSKLQSLNERDVKLEIDEKVDDDSSFQPPMSKVPRLSGDNKRIKLNSLKEASQIINSNLKSERLDDDEGEGAIDDQNEYNENDISDEDSENSNDYLDDETVTLLSKGKDILKRLYFSFIIILFN